MEHLVAIPRNPIPFGAVAGRFVGHDGVGLRYARWPGALKVRKGTVCLFGGRTEFIEKYFETVGDLRRRGFAVAIMDWRGQGGSQRLLANPRKGHVEDFADYDRDLDTFMREAVLPDCPPPYFALGHSMGGHILLRAAPRKDCWFERIVLSAPMVGLAGLRLSPSAVSALTEALVYLGLGDAYIPGGGDGPREAESGAYLTSDAQRLARNLAVLDAAPELGLGSPTIGWARAAAASMRHVDSAEFPPGVRTPILMVAAGNDRIVSGLAIERLAMQLRAGAQVVVPGAAHELLQERNAIREQFWAAFDAFVPGSLLEDVETSAA